MLLSSGIYDRTFGTLLATVQLIMLVSTIAFTYTCSYLMHVEPRLFIPRGKIENGCKYEDHSIRCH